uniref:Uncharacterized protein n=1 Tax=Oryza sativa subsp. japonica TaxID=39947 RepID=Q6K7T1_ORYSJ|nr:hypothetical protein [Oryza sativa Japonica Group]BAD21841.1 hypothetical protein [Oryza sativa Japonica Group]
MPPPLWSLVFCGAYLIDGGGGERGVGMSNYRVLCMFGELACVFSPGNDGGWRFVDTGLKYGDGEDVEFPEDTQFVGRAAGKIYWWAPGGLVQVFDEATDTFFLMEFPKHMRWEYHKSNLRVIGGVDGGGIRVVRMTGEDLEIYGESGGGEWAVERSVRLAEATRGLPGRQEVFFTAEAPAARIVTAGGDGFVTLAPAEDETWLFSVDLETMEAERDHERNKHVGEAHPCSAPPLAAVFRACGDSRVALPRGGRVVEPPLSPHPTPLLRLAVARAAAGKAARPQGRRRGAPRLLALGRPGEPPGVVTAVTARSAPFRPDLAGWAGGRDGRRWRPRRRPALVVRGAAGSGFLAQIQRTLGWGRGGLESSRRADGVNIAGVATGALVQLHFKSFLRVKTRFVIGSDDVAVLSA